MGNGNLSLLIQRRLLVLAVLVAACIITTLSHAGNVRCNTVTKDLDGNGEYYVPPSSSESKFQDCANTYSGGQCYYEEPQYSDGGTRRVDIYCRTAPDLCEYGASVAGGQCGDPPCDDTPEACTCRETGGTYSSGLQECFPNTDTDDGTGEEECRASGGTFGQVNGNPVCLDPGYGAPACSAGGNVATYDDSDGGTGFVCEADTTGEATERDPNEGDTDGDGIPDHSDPDIDDDGTPNEHDDDIDGDGILNENDSDYRNPDFDTGAIEQRLDLIADNTFNTAQNIGAITEHSNATRLATEGVKSAIDDLNDHIQSDGERSTDEFGTDTIEATNERIGNMISSHPFVSSVVSIPTLASSNTCPTFTIGSTKFWQSLTMDIHCTVLEENRATIQFLMLAMFALAAGVIFLKA